MKSARKIYDSLNIFGQCKSYGVRIWQCPQFLFVMMGGVIIVAILATDVVARKFVSPEVVALIALGVTAILFIISQIVVSSFERVANSSKAKSQFIAIMSHRLRSPLCSIKWNLDIFSGDKSKLDEKEAKDAFAEIGKQNEKMIRIVDDLLALNNIEDNNIALNPDLFSLRELAREAIEIQGKEGGGMPSSFISLSSPDSLENVFADKQKIKNIISCLLDNAVRYGSENGKVSVAIEQLPRYVKFLVSDDGPGILDSEIKKVFSKFYRSQLQERTHHQTEGTGIGLFIAKAIIEKSGGKMGFNSIEGRGSTFWFTLPNGKK